MGHWQNMLMGVLFVGAPYVLGMLLHHFVVAPTECRSRHYRSYSSKRRVAFCNGH